MRHQVIDQRAHLGVRQWDGLVVPDLLPVQEGSSVFPQHTAQPVIAVLGVGQEAFLQLVAVPFHQVGAVRSRPPELEGVL